MQRNKSIGLNNKEGKFNAYLEVVKETEQAYRLRYEGKEFWMPKSAFVAGGELADEWGYRLLSEKLAPTAKMKMAARENYLSKHPEIRKESANRHVMYGQMDNTIKRDDK